MKHCTDLCCAAECKIFKKLQLTICITNFDLEAIKDVQVHLLIAFAALEVCLLL